jgi:extradiol dioxygenase family protein
VSRTATTALRPFHFAFHVLDLASTRRFYGDVLGCREGRSTETWVDFDFFGTRSPPTRRPSGDDGSDRASKHPGADAARAILGWDEFHALAERIRAGVSFVLEPRIRYPGQPGEQATMFLLDPSGNALEFKSFRHPEHVFTA